MNSMTSQIIDSHMSRDTSLFFGNSMGGASFETQLHLTPLSMTWWTRYVMNSNRQKKTFFPKHSRPFTLLHVLSMDDNCICKNESKRYKITSPTTFESWKLLRHFISAVVIAHTSCIAEYKRILVTNNFTRNFGAKLYKLKALTGAITEDEGVEQNKNSITLQC